MNLNKILGGLGDVMVVDFSLIAIYLFKARGMLSSPADTCVKDDF